jgi:hypothetical protein
MRCEWSVNDGGVTSRGEKQVLSLLNADDDYNFKTIVETKEDETPTGALPPAQYQAGEEDSISTFRKQKASVTKGSKTKNFSQAKQDDDSATKKSTQTDDTSSIATTNTTSSKRSKSSLNSKTMTIASELTSSMDVMSQNVNAMQTQFAALMAKLDGMNDRVGALEVVPNQERTQEKTMEISVPITHTRDDRVPEQGALPASTHPPEAKEDEKPS